MYSFQIMDKEDSRAMKLYKKINMINFATLHKGVIHIASGIIVFSLISILNKTNISILSLFRNHTILQLIFSVFVSMFLYSLYMTILDENGVYRKMSKVLNCPVYIKKIDLRESDDNEEIDGIEIPQLRIKYDVDNSEGTVAVLMPIRDGQYKIVSIIDNQDVGKDKITIIPSIKLKEALLEVEEISDQYICTLICKINSNKQEGGYISDVEIDIRSIVAEAFVVEMNH